MDPVFFGGTDMFRSIFNPDNSLMITITQITDCIFLSLFWLLGCFPVITAGAATAALYHAVWREFRQGDKHSWQQFLKSFRQNLKMSLVPAVIILVLGGILIKGMILVWNSAVYGNISWAVFAAAAFMATVIVGIGSILFPMLSRFDNSTAALFSNTIRLGLAHLPRTLALGLINGMTILLCIRYVIPLFFLPALAALISTLFIEPMFRPYMPKEDAA
jgi:uncharacterized membrane protein YesL